MSENKGIYIVPENHEEYNHKMKLLKEKSQEFDDNNILLRAMKELLDKIEEDEKEREKQKNLCPCFGFHTVHCCPFSLF